MQSVGAPHPALYDADMPVDFGMLQVRATLPCGAGSRALATSEKEPHRPDNPVRVYVHNLSSGTCNSAVIA